MSADIGLRPGTQEAIQVARLAKEQNISPENAHEEIRNSQAPRIETAAPSPESTLDGDRAKLKAMGKTAQQSSFVDFSVTVVPQESPVDQIKRVLAAKGLDVDPAGLSGLSAKDLGVALAKAQSDNPQEALGRMGVTTASSKDYDDSKELGVSALATPAVDFRVSAQALTDGTSAVLDVNSERKITHDQNVAAPGGTFGRVMTEQKNPDASKSADSSECSTPFSMAPKPPGMATAGGSGG